MKEDRDLGKTYPIWQFVDKLRRLADCLEAGQQFEIQVAGERVRVPVGASALRALNPVSEIDAQQTPSY